MLMFLIKDYLHVFPPAIDGIYKYFTFICGRGRYSTSSESVQNLRIKTRTQNKQKQVIEPLLMHVVAFEKGKRKNNAINA